MRIKKEELRNLLLTDFILWGIIVLILKLHNPHFVTLDNLISAISKKDVIAIFFVCGIVFFALISYISFLCGLFVVYDETIGKIVRMVKCVFNKYEFESNYYYEDECYRNIDILLIAAFTFAALPLMMYFILPALTAVLLLIFIFYCILQIFMS